MENNSTVSQPTLNCDNSKTMYAMAHVTVQQWPSSVYDGDTALSRGTIFCELDLPYVARGVN